jgi:hypothetical protein
MSAAVVTASVSRAAPGSDSLREDMDRGQPRFLRWHPAGDGAIGRGAVRLYSEAGRASGWPSATAVTPRPCGKRCSGAGVVLRKPWERP